MALSNTDGEKIVNAERDALIMELRRNGKTLQTIAAQVGITHQRVHQIIKERLAEIPVESVQHYRAAAVEILDNLLAKTHAVLEAQHLKFHEGVALTHNGEIVTDNGPVLAAVAMILRIEERRAKLLGTDSPARTEVSGGVAFRYSFPGADEV